MRGKGLRLAIILVLAQLAGGAISGLRVLGVTPTQAVLSYFAPSAGACTVEASTSPTYSPLVYDVDTALFTASNLDSRTGSLTDGRQRYFVLGTRSADLASDGRRVSRALRAETPYYVRVACGGDSATTNFTTANIQLGSTYNEVHPTDPANPGVPAWPTPDWTSRAAAYIDPLTGVELRLASLPTDSTPTASAGSFTNTGRGTNWASPDNVLADDSNSATYSAATSDPLFVTCKELAIGSTPNPSYNTTSESPNYLLVRVKGTNAAAVEADRTHSVCLSDDYVACAANGVTHTVTLTAVTDSCKVDGGSLISPCVMGTTTPLLDYWTTTGNKGIAGPNVTAHWGSKATLTSGVLSVGASDYVFGETWKAGSRIWMCPTGTCGTGRAVCGAGTAYTIASNDSPRQLTISAPPANGSYDWCGSNFGFLFWKSTSSLDQTSLQYLGYTKSWGYSGQGKSAGVYMCNMTKTNGGYRCLLQQEPGNGVYRMTWIHPGTGETRFLGLAKTGSIYCTSTESTFDATDPNIIYCPATGDSIAKHTYIGNDAAVPGNSTWNTTYTTLIPSIRTLLTAYDSAYVDAWYTYTWVWGTQNNLLYVMARTSQNASGWIAAIDPYLVGSAPGCVGGGSPGCIVGATNSWANYPARWCGLHTWHVDPTGIDNWTEPGYLDLPTGGGSGQGPFRTTTVTAMGSELIACPDPSLNVLGIPDWPTGDNCSLIVVSGEPCDPSPSAAETVRSSKCTVPASDFYVQDAQQGDYFYATQGALREFGRLLTKPALNTWVIERHYGYYPVQDFAPGATLTAKCGGTSPEYISASNSVATWWNSILYPHGTGQLLDTTYKPGGHGFIRRDRRAMHFNECAWGWGPCYGYRRGYLPAAAGQPIDYWMAENPAFAGATGIGAPNTVDLHSAYTHPYGSGAVLETFLDARPLCSAGGVSGTFTKISGQLWKATISLDRKRLPTIASCGYHPVLDISNPGLGNTILDNAADSYKYCYARANGECRTGSLAGEAYLNCPRVNSGTCPEIGASGGKADDINICMANNGAYTETYVQMGLASSYDQGTYNRILSRGLSMWRLRDDYWNLPAIPDGAWAFGVSRWLGLRRSEWVSLRLPSPAAMDSVNRGTFVPIPVVLASVPSGTNNAVVEFGYNQNFYCTSRQEACVAHTAAIDETLPFHWAGESFSGLSCAAGCTVMIPALPQRVVYFRARYRDAGGATIQFGPSLIAVSH